MRCSGGNRLGRGSKAGPQLMAASAENQEPEEKPLRPKQCHKYMQKTLASQFRKIVSGFVSEAEKGGCAHMKLAVELLQPIENETRQKSSAQRLLEELGE